MDNLPENILQALHRYANGEATAEEIKVVDAWVSGLELEAGLAPDVDAELDNIYARSRQKLMATVQERRATHVTKFGPLLTYGKLAASVIGLIVLSAGAYWAVHQYNGATNTGVSANTTTNTALPGNDALPGSKQAILALNDGKIFDLSKMPVGLLASEGDATIEKTAAGQLKYTGANTYKSTGGLAPLINTIAVPAGGEYMLTLSDGTKVWMNAASKLRFPSEFSEGSRQVELLAGEAYFEIAQNASHPFYVIAGNKNEKNAMQLQVLGTSFTVNAYDPEKGIRTTLVDGAVKINGNSPVILKPGQQAQYAAGAIQVSQGDVDIATAWKQGDFLFDNTPLADAMGQISRWYNVKVKYPNNIIPDSHLNGRFSRSKKLSEILQSLDYVGIQYHIANNTIVIQ